MARDKSYTEVHSDDAGQIRAAWDDFLMWKARLLGTLMTILVEQLVPLWREYPEGQGFTTTTMGFDMVHF